MEFTAGLSERKEYITKSRKLRFASVMPGVAARTAVHRTTISFRGATAGCAATAAVVGKNNVARFRGDVMGFWDTAGVALSW